MEILKWEYETIDWDNEILAELGKKGWEAVGVSHHNYYRSVLLKRPCGKIQMKEVSRENKQDVGESGYDGH